METNRYSPPATAVADVALASDGYQPVRFWPPSGRIGRLRFLAYSLALYLIVILGALVLGLVAGFVARGSSTATVVGAISGIAYLIAGTVLLVQRSHDMNLSGWWSVAALIPFVGLLWVFKGGTRGANRWGAPPPPNGIVVRIAGLAMPIVAVVGILAAVALPAYQQYTIRANANAGAPR